MNNPVEIDIIILSYAKNDFLKNVTMNAITSLLLSENKSSVKFNIIVLESEQSLLPFCYEHTNTVYPALPFNYHKYMNIGIRLTSAPFVCLCNNDLIFHKGWATEILKPFNKYADLYSASPICSNHHPAHGIEINSGIRFGYQIREEVSGWCLFFRRDLLKITGMLDPNYKFWCADNDYINTLWVLGLPHILVTNSIVDHLENTTLHEESITDQLILTEGECIYFEKKWLVKTGANWIAL